MNDKSKPQDTPPKPAATQTPADKPVATKPTVKARKPISKAEYARTTQLAADSTAVIPAVKEGSDPTPSGEVSQSAAAPTAKNEPAAKSKPAPASKAAAHPAPSAAKTVTKTASAPAAAVAQSATKSAAGSTKTLDPLTDTATHQAIDDHIAPAVDKPVEKTAVTPTVTPAAEPEATSDRARRRKVRRKLTYIEPWTVTKMSFVISVAMMIVFVVAAVVFWFVMQVTGVWEALNDSVVNVLSDGSSRFDITDYVGLARITGLTLIVSAFNVVFSTGLATIGAHLYNLAASMMGGVEVTFEDRKN